MISMDNSSNLINIFKKYSSHILLVILIIIISLITYYRVIIQIDIGPLSDSCDFLSNAFVFAGQNMSYFDPTRPPFFSFLLSLIFKMGFVDTNTIFILDGLLYIFGVIGLYFLLKLHFNDIESFLGALLYATFHTILVVMGSGFSDLASVSFTIWTLYFLILAVKRDSKFFYLTFPFAMLAFLTRYNSALIIFPILLYILINKTEIKNIKNIFIGISASVLLLIPVFIFFYEKSGNLLYSFTSSFGMTSNTSLSGNVAYDPNLFFFIDRFPSFIGFEGIFIILIIVGGFLLYAILKFKQTQKKLPNGLKIETPSKKIKWTLFGVLTLLFIGSFGQILSYFSEVLFFILIYLFYDLIKNLNIKDIDTHLLFFTWFMAFFIFQSIFVIKDNRYFVVMAPPVAYFLVLCLSKISNEFAIKIKKHNVTFPLLAVVLTLIIFFSAAITIPSIQESNHSTKVTNEIVTLASDWFIKYDPYYKNKIIYSDLWPQFSWYLKTNVIPMPEFKGGQKFYSGVTDYNLTPQDNIEYNQELNNNNVDYYFSARKGLNLSSYKPIKQFGSLIIYKKIA
jgi:4-amino-4-deoxy-L-arabinose transferase-like glycosyltransferase